VTATIARSGIHAERILEWGVYGLMLLAPLAFLPMGSVLVEAEIAYVEVPKVYLLRAVTAAMLPFVAMAIYNRGLRFNLISGLVLVLVGWSIVATIFSTDPGISFWGEFNGQDGTPLIATLHYLVLFLAVAVAFSTPERIHRLLTIIAVSGALTSIPVILQHFGLFPINLYPEGVGRPPGTFGNPVFAGSFISLTAMVTLYLAMRRPIWGLLSVPQILALTLASSRAGLLGLLIFGVVAIAWYAWRQRGAPTALGIGLFSALLILGAIYSIPEISGRIINGPKDISGRLTIWQHSLELIKSRPWTGVGPDMFRYHYLQVSPAGPTGIPEEPDHAHNWIIHNTAEMGIGGGLLTAGLAGASVAVSGPLGVVFAGRLAEQMLGVGRVSDMMLFWILLGVAYNVRLHRHDYLR
jgi:O-antigen ligase